MAASTTPAGGLDPELAARAAREAEPGVLAAVLAQLTGDLHWACNPELDSLRAGQHAEDYLANAADALRELCAAGTPTTTDLDDATLLEIARTALSAELTAAALPRLRHHLWPQASWPTIDPGDAVRSGLNVTIIGAGMSGLGLAFSLSAAGIGYTILERRDGLGGVWFDNRYPDCGVDTQVFQYAFELMPSSEWTRYDAKRDEILDYIKRAAEKAGVLSNIRFGVEVEEAAWEGDRWSLRATHDGRDERIETDVLVSAVGALNRPKIPDIPGLADFAGPAFHTAEWHTSVDLAGQRVALVGNGSSGTQVGRAIADQAARLIAFQRTPHWIGPRPRGETGKIGDGMRWLVENLPFYLGWYRFYLNFVIGDGEHPKLVRTGSHRGFIPTEDNDRLRAELTAYIRERLAGREDLIEKLTPTYPPYAKRLVVDNGWYDTLTRPHVNLVTDSIDRITPTGIVTSDGTHHDVDIIVFATGFHGTRYFWPMEIIGRSRRSLAETHGGPENIRAYLGVVMPGYPNFFALQGPNSSVGHGGGVTFMSECQSRFVLDCLKTMIDEGLRTLEIRREVTDRYNADMDIALQQMVWAADGLGSRYRNTEGRIVMNHPWTIGHFYDLTRQVQRSEFHRH